MVSKDEKVDDINAAINRSELARERGALADIGKGGGIVYSLECKSGLGRPYRCKAKFSEILRLLEGKDIRYLKSKYGKQR